MFSLCNVILRKLVYPLPAIMFTEKECSLIMRPILQQGLLAMGVVCTFPRALAHRPFLSYQGLNIPNSFTEQTITHIETLLKCQDQPVSQTIQLGYFQASRKAMHLEMGLTDPLFEAPVLLQDLIMDSWMKHTWLSAATYDIHLQLSLLDFTLQRVHDIKLVKLFLHHGIRQPQLRMLHRCHMDLK